MLKNILLGVFVFVFAFGMYSLGRVAPDEITVPQQPETFTIKPADTDTLVFEEFLNDFEYTMIPAVPVMLQDSTEVIVYNITVEIDGHLIPTMVIDETGRILQRNTNLAILVALAQLDNPKIAEVFRKFRMAIADVNNNTIYPRP